MPHLFAIRNEHSNVNSRRMAKVGRQVQLFSYKYITSTRTNLCLIPCTETLSLKTGSMISFNLWGSWIVVSRESFCNNIFIHIFCIQFVPDQFRYLSLGLFGQIGLPGPWAPSPGHCIARNISPSLSQTPQLLLHQSGQEKIIPASSKLTWSQKASRRIIAAND